MHRSQVGAILERWRSSPGGPEQRLRRFGSLMVRLIAYGALLVVFASGVISLALAVFGAAAFRSTPLALGLLVASLGGGFWLARPAWRRLIGEHRFRCFYCQGQTARARRHDSMRNDVDDRHQVGYSFECERCGRSDGEL